MRQIQEELFVEIGDPDVEGAGRVTFGVGRRRLQPPHCTSMVGLTNLSVRNGLVQLIVTELASNIPIVIISMFEVVTALSIAVTHIHWPPPGASLSTATPKESPSQISSK